MTITPFPLPNVNLNGTDGQTLLTQVTNATSAGAAFMEALTAMTPHGRDYQYNPDGDAATALVRHRERIAAVAQVLAELDVMVHDLYTQVDARRRR